MKYAVLICIIFLGCGVLPLRAGKAITLTDAPETFGAVTLTPAAVHVETSSSPVDINLSDVLEADFGETPFQLDYFSSSGRVGSQLPATWKEQDIGTVTTPGSMTNADGTFMLSGSGAFPQQRRTKVWDTKSTDNLFFVGQPWPDDGQWTAQVKEIDALNPGTTGGLMLRNTLDADSVMVSLGVTIQGNSGVTFRPEVGKRPQSTLINIDLPLWLRLTRYGANIFAATSHDGQAWEPINETTLKNLASPWIGLFADCHKDNTLGKVVIDHVSFTPPPSSAQVLLPGVLLQSGSFLAGAFEHLSFDPANPDAPGNFLRNGKTVTIPRSKIAAVTMLPTDRSQIAGMGSQAGLLMKNGDVQSGDFNSINSDTVLISTVLLGDATYNRSEVRACFLHPVLAQPASYEIRLKDGSIIEASGVTINNADIMLQEVSGVNVDVSPNEIAQFRAGSSQVEPLAGLDWKATPPSSAPSTNAAPAPAAAPEQVPPVQNWRGPNQEQIMATPVGTTIDFPLAGKFRAIGAWIALTPDSPPNSQLTVRVLADGKEVARTPPFKAGDQPRFMQATISEPKTVTLEADSSFAGAKVLFIDPVAIRDKSL